MKKLIEFQEDKHSEVINIIAQFRADNNTTFSEAVRRLILCSQNGNCPTEPVCPEPSEDRLEALEKKVDVLVKTSKVFKTHMERMNDHDHLEDGSIIPNEHSDEE